jgi:hypothetical protein
VSNDISSTEFIWGGTGTSVAYNAGSVITLSPGFEVKAGSKFEAYIQGCTTAGLPPRPLKPITTDNKSKDKAEKPVLKKLFPIYK